MMSLCEIHTYVVLLMMVAIIVMRIMMDSQILQAIHKARSKSCFMYIAHTLLKATYVLVGMYSDNKAVDDDDDYN